MISKKMVPMAGLEQQTRNKNIVRAKQQCNKIKYTKNMASK